MYISSVLRMIIIFISNIIILVIIIVICSFLAEFLLKITEIKLRKLCSKM